MRVLIFSMTCGEGHNNIAKSLKEQFDNFAAVREREREREQF